MAAFLEPKDRSVLPRWRDFETTLSQGELSHPIRLVESQESEGNLAELEGDWNRERTISFAADLISAALIHSTGGVALEAAEYVLELQGESQPDHPLTLVAKRILDRQRNLPSRLLASDSFQAKSTNEIYAEIRANKRILNISPRNAIRWVDLSLLYAMNGQRERSERAMKTAVGLEGENRFVLRSAARLFVHLGEPDRAHRLLRNTDSIRVDPWIMAAEIAIATSAKFLPFSIDQATRLLKRDNLEAAETSDLSAAVATLEFAAGQTRKAKKLSRNGLRMPNENSLAQVQWLSRKMNGFVDDSEIEKIKVSRSFESDTWAAHAHRSWPEAVLNAVRWLKDQPFSSRPANVASSILAGPMRDFPNAIKMARQGLIANPSENSLHLTVAFSHASLGDLEEAQDAMAQVKPPLSNTLQAVYLANFGLIQFRSGNVDIGRRYYEEAVARAATVDPVLEASALTYWAREEVGARTREAKAIFDRADAAVSSLAGQNGEAEVVFSNVKAEVEAQQSL